MKKAVIVGGTGFGGLGLIDILHRHPEFEISQIIDIQNTGTPVSDIFPHLRGFCDIKIQENSDIDYKNTDIAFFSTPDRVGMKIINNFYNNNIPVIDFSGDFRFNSTDEYGEYARNKGMDELHHSPEILKEAVYGLPEKNRDLIESAKIVGNPGCFAISMILGLLPAADKGLLKPGTIICDGKTGVSGAGKNAGDANLYPNRYENQNTYREGSHQHLVEVENVINSAAGENKLSVFFVPQIIPLNRGILTTIYADLNNKINTTEIENIYREYYKDSPFVVITDKSPNTKNVRGSNRCEIRVMVDKRTGKFFATSVIDNLMKGQAGNAVQNANLIMGFEETAGLKIPAFYP